MSRREASLTTAGCVVVLVKVGLLKISGVISYATAAYIQFRYGIPGFVTPPLTNSGAALDGEADCTYTAQFDQI